MSDGAGVTDRKGTPLAGKEIARTACSKPAWENSRPQRTGERDQVPDQGCVSTLSAGDLGGLPVLLGDRDQPLRANGTTLPLADSDVSSKVRRERVSAWSPMWRLYVRSSITTLVS